MLSLVLGVYAQEPVPADETPDATEQEAPAEEAPEPEPAPEPDPAPEPEPEPEPEPAPAPDLEGASPEAGEGPSRSEGTVRPEPEPAPGHDAHFKAGKGLKITSADGNWALNTHLRGQLRLTLSGSDDGPVPTFALHRARVTWSGHLVNEDIAYKVQLGVSPKDLGTKDGTVTTSPVMDWLVDFRRFDAANVRLGQYKVPYNREHLISSSALSLVDRSLTHGEFTLDRDLGFDVHASELWDGKARYHAGVFAGEGRNTNTASDWGFLYVARVEVSPLGRFEDTKQADFARSADPRLALGAAVAFLDEAKRDEGIKGSTPADGGTTDTWNATGDVVFKLRGLTLLTQLNWRQGTRNPGVELQDDGTYVVDAPRNGWGWLGQVGYLLPGQDVGFSGRASLVRGTGDTSLDEANELAAGASWYLAGHSLKAQADVFRTWGTDGWSSGVTQARLQLQVAY